MNKLTKVGTFRILPQIKKDSISTDYNGNWNAMEKGYITDILIIKWLNFATHINLKTVRYD